MLRMYDLRQKEVINTRDGSRFGFITDIVIDEDEGQIVKLIVPGPGRVFGFFGKDHEFQIPWEAIVQIGDDIILINCDTDKILKDLE